MRLDERPGFVNTANTHELPQLVLINTHVSGSHRSQAMFGIQPINSGERAFADQAINNVLGGVRQKILTTLIPDLIQSREIPVVDDQAFDFPNGLKERERGKGLSNASIVKCLKLLAARLFS
ncbi:hypothetical protein KNO81_31330 [Paraburkholderia sediminicola]|nr:hypothetical protein [Paraburkholderia sediminicola]